jgi:single-strand DNA-binding protein
MNVWTFSGRVGADAELRTTQSGEKVLSFRVANDIGFGDRRTTQWVDCSMWGKRAESVANYVKKGDKITVSGELKLEEFQRRDGTPGSKLAVRVNELDLASRQESAGGGGGGRDHEAGGGGG